MTGHAAPTARRASAPATKAVAPPASARARVTAAPAAAAGPVAAPGAQAIVPVSAVAFGPQGTADGDNPENAARVLTDPALGWQSQWYATPNFGDLKQGTGLLLDMGRTVSISTVSLELGSPPGAELQVRLGTTPDIGALPVAATATAAGGALSLPLAAPAKARYVLVWFTRLPPDGAGTYQVFVRHITVRGRP